MLSLLTSKLGITLGLLAICLVASCTILRRCDRIWNPPEPRIVTHGPFEVKDVPNGASITVASGLRDRRTRTIHLQYVQAPASGEWAQLSADHLRDLAGGKITVKTERHGLLRGEATAEAPATVGNYDIFSSPNEIVCPDCKGTSERALSGDDEIAGYFAMWMAPHVYKCKQCKEANSEEELCGKAKTALAKLCDEFKGQKTVMQQCDCDGGYVYQLQPGVVANFRAPLVGIVFGASGIDCNLAQINHGFADCTDDAPKNYRVARDLAKKAKEGIWGAKR